MIYRVTLPLPPSVNGSLMPVVRGRYKSGPKKGQPMAILAPTKAMEDWKAEAMAVINALRTPELLSGPVEFYAEFFLPSLASDCSNRLKACEDILRGYAYLDDKQVAEDHAFKRIALTEADQRVVIVVRPANPEEHPELVRRLAESEKRAARKARPRSVPARVATPKPLPAPKVEHFVGDACPGGHVRLAGTKMTTLGRDDETTAQRLRRMATPASYGGKR